MAQSSFSGTSLCLLLLGGPTLLLTHYLLCRFDNNFSLWPKSKPWKIVDTSSALQTRGLVTSVCCSSSDSSDEIKEECRASKSYMLFSSSLTIPAVFSPVSKEHKEILSINFGCIKNQVTLSHLKCMRIVHSGESHYAYMCCFK